MKYESTAATSKVPAAAARTRTPLDLRESYHGKMTAGTVIQSMYGTNLMTILHRESSPSRRQRSTCFHDCSPSILAHYCTVITLGLANCRRAACWSATKRTLVRDRFGSQPAVQAEVDKRDRLTDSPYRSQWVEDIEA